ncbi:four-carbon acid sugar kinase family protein [Labrys sp. LIt4]|uniref:four-carbon acid sugar kinase family protein n=1 Tax=Labrys sp. LIt4 TaxID=2821355 RepID=UPI001ADEEFCF|nr:four-carbon acid sugar kinase family protein [Labrys sp. LIt4]MBP0581134.1 four-carbon acid sugar kinase family protein [Labrys sp. LIt4]
MLAILADDLTGALDTAAPFAARGMHAQVALTIDAIDEAVREGPDVVSINLASRELSADTARHLTAAALAALPAGTRLFKKVDSRLKGHVAAELDALPFRAALMAPAIPDFGRVVKAGCVQGFGVETPISIVEKLGPHAVRATIPDIPDQDGLRVWLARSEEEGIDLLIGARGLAEALAERLTGRAVGSLAEIADGPALFVIGSHDPITLAQVDALRAAFDPHYLPAPNGRLAEPLVDGNAITLVQAVPGEETVTSREVSQALAQSVFPSLAQVSTLLLSGGETAQALLEKMEIGRFRLLGECQPGLGLAHARGHCIIAKSGGFGQPDTLSRIAGQILRKTG